MDARARDLLEQYIAGLHYLIVLEVGRQAGQPPGVRQLGQVLDHPDTDPSAAPTFASSI